MAGSNAQSINKLKLGMILKATREANEINQKDMAYKLGYASATFISQVENGKVPVPPQRAAAFASFYTGTYLGCPPEADTVKLTLMILRLSQETTWDAWAMAVCGAFGKDVTKFTATVDELIRTRLLECGAEF